MKPSIWLAALACAGLAALGGFWLSGRPLAVYLAAFGFASSSVVGGLILLMLGSVTGATWFVALRRLCEPAALGSGVLVFAFAPLVLGAGQLYPWAPPQRSVSAAHAIWQSLLAFAGRGWLCLLLWTLWAELLRRQKTKSAALSAVGLPLVITSGSLAVFDWISGATGAHFNLLGLYVLSGGFVAACGSACVMLHLGRRLRWLPVAVGEHHAHALGRLLLTAVCIWAYLAASLLIIVWSANLPSEAAFVLPRYHGWYRALALVLVGGHFGAPFLLLLSKGLKRKSACLAALGTWLVLMHGVDLVWLILPTFAAEPRLVDLLAFAGLTALLVSYAGWRFRNESPVPEPSPELARSLRYEAS